MNDIYYQRPSFLYSSVSLIVIIIHIAIFYLLCQLTIPEKKPINQPLINVPRIEIELVNSSHLSTEDNNTDLQTKSTTDTQNKHEGNQHTTPQFFPELFPQSNTPTIANSDIETSNIAVDTNHPNKVPSGPSTYSFNDRTYSVEDSNNLPSDDTQHNIFDYHYYNDSISKSTKFINPSDSVQTRHDSPQEAQDEKVLNFDIITHNTTTSPSTMPVEETNLPNPMVKPFKPKNITPPVQPFSADSNDENANTVKSNQINNQQQEKNSSNSQSVASTKSSDNHSNQTVNKLNNAPQHIYDTADRGQSRNSRSIESTQDSRISITDNTSSVASSSITTETQRKVSNDFGYLITEQQNYQTVTNPADVKKPIVLTSLPIYVSAEASMENLIEPITPILPIQLKHSPTRKWKVVLILYVDKQGKIMQQPEPIVKLSSGNTFIDEDALSFVRKARFRPFIRNGKPQIAEVRLPLTYQR